MFAVQLNMSDIPELMAGAKPGANPAARHDFEERCKVLHDEAEDEDAERAEQVRLGSGAGATTSDFEAMFPALEASLVQALAADAPTPQHAFETLLALAAATAEVSAEGSHAPHTDTPPPLDLKTNDLEKFPTLGASGLQDKDGWQVVSQRDLARDADEELGNVWRDRAKEAAQKPSVWGPREQAVAPVRRKPASTKELASAPGVQHESIVGDYNLRQRMGQRRADNIAQYRRRRAGKGQGESLAEARASEGEEEEAEEEEFRDGA